MFDTEVYLRMLAPWVLHDCEPSHVRLGIVTSTTRLVACPYLYLHYRGSLVLKERL